MKRFVRLLILFLVRLIGAPRALSPTLPFSDRMRILLLRPDHLGDLLLITPALTALRTHAPDAEITLMTGPWSREVVERHPAIDHLLTCPFPGFQRAPQRALEPYKLLFQTAALLRSGNYDMAINLRPDFWWGAALLYLAAIPHRIGYALEPGRPFLTHTLPFPDEPEHAAVSNLRLVNMALVETGCTPLAEPYEPKSYPLHFVPTREEQFWAASRLREAGIDAATPFVLIHPGTGAPVKLWRTSAWTSCALALTRALTFPTQARIVLTGSKSELPMLEEIAEDLTIPPLLVTDATIGQLAALLSHALLVLGVDSGPLHLAVSQSIPTLQIFGPTDVHIFGPWGMPEHHIVIQATLRCPTCPAIPCGRLDIAPDDLPAHPCVRLVSEQQVMEVISTIIGTGTSFSTM